MTKEKIKKKYESNDINLISNKFIKEMKLIERRSKENKINKGIEETMVFAERIECMLKDAVDIEQEIDDCIIEVLRELIAIKNCYSIFEFMFKEFNSEEADFFKSNLYYIIEETVCALSGCVD
ncbi:MAG: hypothetical protein IJH34_18030 [Romboutsia sp.]|nr:hypothetical protein [Romboutsia sp.]